MRGGSCFAFIRSYFLSFLSSCLENFKFWSVCNEWVLFWLNKKVCGERQFLNDNQNMARIALKGIFDQHQNKQFLTLRRALALLSWPLLAWSVWHWNKSDIASELDPFAVHKIPLHSFCGNGWYVLFVLSLALTWINTENRIWPISTTVFGKLVLALFLKQSWWIIRVSVVDQIGRVLISRGRSVLFVAILSMIYYLYLFPRLCYINNIILGEKSYASMDSTGLHDTISWTTHTDSTYTFCWTLVKTPHLIQKMNRRMFLFKYLRP